MRVLAWIFVVVALIGLAFEVFEGSRDAWISGLALGVITVPFALLAIFFFMMDSQRRQGGPRTPGNGSN